MMIDAVPLAEQSHHPAVRSFLAFLESRIGVRIIRDCRTIPWGKATLADILALAEQLKSTGIITSYAPQHSPPDEPRFFRWTGFCANSSKHSVSGAHFFDERAALMSMCGEALERYLWQEATDHAGLIQASLETIAKRGPYIHPNIFAGADDALRKKHPALYYSQKSVWSWALATSLHDGNKKYIPFQAVSGNRNARIHNDKKEPVITPAITTGAAVWPTAEGARLRAMYELFERDAYMIWWLNQLTPPRINLDTYISDDPYLKKIAASLERYRLKTHALLLPTDAPLHVLLVVIEDSSGHAPRYAFGLKAGKKISEILPGAITEALRGRQGARYQEKEHGLWDTATPVSSIGHLDRLRYWAVPEHAQRLETFVTGPISQPSVHDWDTASDEQHFKKIISWCKEKKYDVLSVSAGRSRLNPLPFACEIVSIPQLQPTYLHEAIQFTAGERITAVPLHLGYTPRTTPYTDAPHPFA